MFKIVLVGCMMENKMNKPTYPKAWTWLKKLQNDRVEAGTDTTQTQISLPKLLLLVINFFNANKIYYQSLVKAEYYINRNKQGEINGTNN